MNKYTPDPDNCCGQTLCETKGDEMATVTLQHTVVLVAETCINCGVVFGIEETHQRNLRKTKASFCCPNGHSMVYRENETDRKLKEALKSLDYERENVSYWRDEAEKTQRSLSATKGVLTRTKNRIANGVCPCCHRQFVNLQRHMSGQHPEYEKGADDEIPKAK